jgi:hypothetical protein
LTTFRAGWCDVSGVARLSDVAAMFRTVPPLEGIFVRANSSVSARVCQAGATALSSEDYDLRDAGEVSHGAVGRSIPDVTTADSALQFGSSVRRRAHPH